MLFLSRLGGSFKDVFIFTFHPDFFGEMIQLEYFSDWVVQPPTSRDCSKSLHL